MATSRNRPSKSRKPDDDLSFEEPYDPLADSDPMLEAQEELAAAREILDVVTREHRRISRDLHDYVGQELTALSYLSSVLASQLRAKGLEEADTADLIVQLAREGHRMLRLAIKGVMPTEVRAAGLPQALADWAGKVRERYGVDCICKVPDSLTLRDDEVAHALLMIAKSACENAAKYAHPSLIQLRLTQSPEGVRLEIENDGQSIDLDDRESITGIGLEIMRTRAKVICAEFRIGPLPRGGTLVEVLIPAAKDGASVRGAKK